jgi:hypothetical protein
LWATSLLFLLDLCFNDHSLQCGGALDWFIFLFGFYRAFIQRRVPGDLWEHVFFLFYDGSDSYFIDSRRTFGAEEVYWALGELEELWFTTCLNNWLGVLVDAPHTSLRRRSEGISSTRFGFSRADHFFVVSTV